MVTRLAGKTVVVTGATSGIGLAVMKSLMWEGASVIGVGRSDERCREARKHLHSICPRVCVDYVTADFTLQDEVRSAAVKVREVLTARGKTGLDGLVNNAGTFTHRLALTQEGFEMQWAVNYLAPFLFTLELLPLLQAAPVARIVTVSSGSHYGTNLNWKDIQLLHRYNGLRAYSQTKLANVLFTLELNRLLGDTSTVKAFAADPGLVKTDIGLKGTPAPVRWIWRVRRAGGVTPDNAAQGIIFLLGEDTIQDAREIYWKSGSPKLPGVHARDSASAGRLWNLSEQMCGVCWRNGNDR